jgi:uncharacterized protein with FMN-binding domain
VWVALRETEYTWYPERGNFMYWLYQNDTVPGGRTVVTTYGTKRDPVTAWAYDTSYGGDAIVRASIETGQTVAPAAPAPASAVASSPSASASRTAEASASPSPAVTASPTASPTAEATPGTQTATGNAYQFRFGIVQVAVTVEGDRIVDVQALQMPDGDRHSASISRQVEPMLRQSALAANSATIDVVSGATYTSTAYAYSLQSALDQLAVG